MARIVIDARRIDSSTGRVVEELLNELQKRDSLNDYKILVLKKEKSYYRPKKANFEVLVADFDHYTFAEQLGLNRFLRSLKADLVFFHMPQQPLLYTKPSITLVHDLNLIRVKENDMGWLELTVKKTIFAVLLWIVAWRSKHIIVPTNYTKKDLIEFSGISAKKVSVTHWGMIKIGRPEPMPKYDKPPFLTYLGRAEPYKNNRRLIKAHQILLTKHPKLSLVIMGKTDELREADIAWVKASGYKNVFFTDWVTDEQAAWLYRRSVAFVQPSFMEGFGMPVLEAMQQGTPVASTNATCSPEVYGNAAQYFDPNSTSGIAEAINDILTNKELRAKLVKNGYDLVKKYTWDKPGGELLRVFKQVLGQ